jgi:protease II
MSYLTINFEADLLRQAKNYAASQGVSLNQLVKNYLVEITNASDKTSPSPSSTDKLYVIQQTNEQRLEQERKAKQELEKERKAKQELEKERKAKQELENIMGMIAHKFRGSIQSLSYNVEHENQPNLSLESIQTMRGLLDIFSTISTREDTLREKLVQDKEGEGTVLAVLEKSLSLALADLLTVSNKNKILQHYLAYAKRNKGVEASVTPRQWAR